MQKFLISQIILIISSRKLAGDDTATENCKRGLCGSNICTRLIKPAPHLYVWTHVAELPRRKWHFDTYQAARMKESRVRKRQIREGKDFIPYNCLPFLTINSSCNVQVNLLYTWMPLCQVESTIDAGGSFNSYYVHAYRGNYYAYGRVQNVYYSGSTRPTICKLFFYVRGYVVRTINLTGNTCETFVILKCLIKEKLKLKILLFKARSQTHGWRAACGLQGHFVRLRCFLGNFIQLIFMVFGLFAGIKTARPASEQVPFNWT